MCHDHFFCFVLFCVWELGFSDVLGGIILTYIFRRLWCLKASALISWLSPFAFGSSPRERRWPRGQTPSTLPRGRSVWTRLPAGSATCLWCTPSSAWILCSSRITCLSCAKGTKTWNVPELDTWTHFYWWERDRKRQVEWQMDDWFAQTSKVGRRDGRGEESPSAGSGQIRGPELPQVDRLHHPRGEAQEWMREEGQVHPPLLLGWHIGAPSVTDRIEGGGINQDCERPRSVLLLLWTEGK